MNTGFATVPVDAEFAQRSARYLANQGYAPGHIRSVLVDELEVTGSFADNVVAALAA